MNIEMTIWLFVTAIMFTFVGRYTARKDDVTDVVASTVDTLIADGYLRTKGEGRNMEILKWNEEEDS
jgi:hypothetical protein